MRRLLTAIGGTLAKAHCQLSKVIFRREIVPYLTNRLGRMQYRREVVPYLLLELCNFPGREVVLHLGNRCVAVGDFAFLAVEKYLKILGSIALGLQSDRAHSCAHQDRST